jgi:hypothetical protein
MGGNLKGVSVGLFDYNFDVFVIQKVRSVYSVLQFLTERHFNDE